MQILIVNGDKALYSDTCDPRSDISRRRVIEKLVNSFPAIDANTVEEELLQLSKEGAPPAVGSISTCDAVDADPEPWPTPVNGEALLDEIAELLRKYVVLPRYGAETIALWIVQTYCFESFEYTPRLLIHSPDKRCGKSRLLRLAAALARRPLACENITAAALFRSIEKFRCTLLLDEADTYLAGSNVNEELRGIVNAGHQRGGKVLRCVGDDNEPMPFNVYAPMVIAMIGKPPATVEDRAIPVQMRRRMPDEQVSRYRPGMSLRIQFLDAVRRCLRWVDDNRESLAARIPAVPQQLDDRAADNWFSLFAIADQAGGQWTDLARQMAISVMAGRDTTSLGTLLLADLRDLFRNWNRDRLTSSEICTALVQMEDRPWPELTQGRAITPRSLAKLLAPFEVVPRNVKRGEVVVKGYLRTDFADAWKRYLPEDRGTPAGASATPLPAFADKDLRQESSATSENQVADAIARKPLSDKGGSGVAEERPGDWPETRMEPRMAELLGLIETLSRDLDASGSSAPFSSETMRQHYREMVQRHGVGAALADAQARFQMMLQGDFAPLRRVAL